jgi:ankyrin repeat protein
LRLYLPVLTSFAAVMTANAASSGLPLVDAIKDGNPKAVAALVAHADVNAKESDGSTALAWAVYKDDAVTVDLLLKAGAKVGVADEYGETPLTLACANGNAAIVDKLLKARADPNAARYYGETPLMIASASGNPDVVRSLIEHGAQIDAVESRRGQNALMWAAAEGNSEAVAVLLKAGANPNAVSKASFTPLVFAAQKGDTKSASSLIAAGADIDYEVQKSANVLLIALMSKKPEVAKILIEKGAAVDGKDPTGNTALHVAAESGDIDTVKRLIAKGADVNAATNPKQGDRMGILQRPPTGQQTPLMVAARVNRPDVMRVLVEAGANPKLHATDGSTLLMAAASGGRIESVRYAFGLDPDMKAMTDRKETVMHAAMIGTRRYATEIEVTQMVQFFADNGAELDPMDINNRTPIALAKIIPLQSTIDLLTRMIVASGAAPKPSKAR